MELNKKYRLLSEINAYTEKVFIPERKKINRFKQQCWDKITEFISGVNITIQDQYLEHVGYCQDPAVILQKIEDNHDLYLINNIGWPFGAEELFFNSGEEEEEYKQIRKKRNAKGRFVTGLDNIEQYNKETRRILDVYISEHGGYNPTDKHPSIILNAGALRVPTNEENDKGGNYISAPNHDVIFYIDHEGLEMPEALSNYTNALLCPLECSFKNKNTFRHIDELMCFMPTGEGTFEIWIYDIEEFKEEQENNKEKIQNSLLKKGYTEDHFRFREFPIELGPNNLFRQPPLFNRLFIETPEHILILFPRNDITDNDDFIGELNDGYIKSYSGEEDKLITIAAIDTLDFHNDGKSRGAAGGNLHCLVKQLLSPIQ